MPCTAAELVASRYRQIHLDFHTAPQIPDVGKDFDVDQFAEMLVEAKVNWITLFGKCHHGMSYYPTKAGVMHPSLKFDLLGQQIEACKRKGIATPVYISVRVDQHMGITRPDLVVRLADGKLWGPNHNEASWYQMCLGNKEYIDYVAAQTEETKAETIDGVRLPAGAFAHFAFGHLVEATVGDGVRLGPLEALASTLAVQNGRLLWGDEYAAGEHGGLRVSVASRNFLASSSCLFHELHKADGMPYLQLLAEQPETCRKVIEGLE